jgi:6-phosphogluconolactonase
MYRLLASPQFQEQVDWDRIQVFWGDERCVPPDNPESNYGMARATLLDAVAIPSKNVFRMPVDRSDLDAGADEYAGQLRNTLPLDVYGIPRFDLVLLGLGPDGHTASLFPSTTALGETHRLVCAPFVPKFSARRMTLTYPVLNAAREILFLVTGSEKAEPLAAVISRAGDPLLPAARVRPREGTRVFFTDAAAAARLAGNIQPT